MNERAATKALTECDGELDLYRSGWEILPSIVAEVQAENSAEIELFKAAVVRESARPHRTPEHAARPLPATRPTPRVPRSALIIRDNQTSSTIPDNTSQTCTANGLHRDLAFGIVTEPSLATFLFSLGR